MQKPLAIDLYCGLGGWTEGLLAEGWEVIGFDIERHAYGDHQYPAQLVLQDVRTIDGAQFKDASLIVASPPCQEFSYMAMPWKRAKRIAQALFARKMCGDGPSFPDGYKGSRTTADLTALFDACFRIQREASKAAARHIPLVVENVRGAQPWVGRSRWSYGSFHLWGDVPALMPITFRGTKVAMQPWRHPSDPRHVPGQGFNTLADRQTKNDGGSWFNVAHNTASGTGQNPDGRKLPPEISASIRAGKSPARWTNESEHYFGPKPDDVKIGGEWFHEARDHSMRKHSSGSSARKAASARIAKIPFPLARHIARCYYPKD